MNRRPPSDAPVTQLLLVAAAWLPLACGGGGAGPSDAARGAPGDAAAAVDAGSPPPDGAAPAPDTDAGAGSGSGVDGPPVPSSDAAPLPPIGLEGAPDPRCPDVAAPPGHFGGWARVLPPGRQPPALAAAPDGEAVVVLPGVPAPLPGLGCAALPSGTGAIVRAGRGPAVCTPVPGASFAGVRIAMARGGDVVTVGHDPSFNGLELARFGADGQARWRRGLGWLYPPRSSLAVAVDPGDDAIYVALSGLAKVGEAPASQQHLLLAFGGDGRPRWTRQAGSSNDTSRSFLGARPGAPILAVAGFAGEPTLDFGAGAFLPGTTLFSFDGETGRASGVERLLTIGFAAPVRLRSDALVTLMGDALVTLGGPLGRRAFVDRPPSELAPPVLGGHEDTVFLGGQSEACMGRDGQAIGAYLASWTIATTPGLTTRNPAWAFGPGVTITAVAPAADAVYLAGTITAPTTFAPGITARPAAPSSSGEPELFVARLPR